MMHMNAFEERLTWAVDNSTVDDADHQRAHVAQQNDLIWVWHTARNH